LRTRTSDALPGDGITETDSSDIVLVKESEVTLNGTVDDRADKRVGEDIAESVSGVRNVQNNLRVKEEQVSTAGLATAKTASPTR
jgi:osmotically-inducible protein OsmY